MKTVGRAAVPPSLLRQPRQHLAFRLLGPNGLSYMLSVRLVL